MVALALKPELAIWALFLLVLLLLSPLSSSVKLVEPPSHGHRRTWSSASTAAAATEAHKELPLVLHPVQATAGTTSPMIATPAGLVLMEVFTHHPDVQMSGSRPGDYYWTKLPSYLAPGGAWLFAKEGASEDPSSYGAVSRTIPAQPYWNKRVLFRALVSVNGLGAASHPALFVRVMGDSASTAGGGPQQGPTLVFDNMRRVHGHGSIVHDGWWRVVVDVPGPPQVPGESCPAEGAVPASIQFGFMLSAGAGRLYVDQVTLQHVGKEYVRLTSDGMPPWEPPGPDFL